MNFLENLKVNTVLHTNGTGLWSDSRRAVKIHNLQIDVFPGDEIETEDFGELRVYFTIKTWNIENHGLIYTDRLFLRELRKFLNSLGLKGSNMDYSEQGMQGHNYVSCDIGDPFIKSWVKITDKK